MSLVVTVYVPEGLAMAADSRLSLEYQVAQGGATRQHSVPSSDSTYKVFVTRENVGIAAFGAASVGAEPVAAIVEAFIAGLPSEPPSSPQEIGDRLLAHFAALNGPPASRFHVAGYDGGDQRVFEVNVVANSVKVLNGSGPGAAWGGEADAVSRLLTRVGSLDASGKLVNELPYFGVAFKHFTLQDAVDFAVYAIRTTSDTMRFQMRPKTVGGPIDVLVIRRDGANWLHRKELRLPTRS